jgi:hypothetical protein
MYKNRLGTRTGSVQEPARYKNRLGACGMPLELECDLQAKDPSTSAACQRRTALDVVETGVKRTRALNGGSRVVAGWVTRIGARDGRGFEVSGSHTFKPTFPG